MQLGTFEYMAFCEHLHAFVRRVCLAVGLRGSRTRVYSTWGYAPVAQFTLPVATCVCSRTLQAHQHLVFHMWPCCWCIIYSIVVLICTFLITNEIESSLICSLTRQTSSFAKKIMSSFYEVFWLFLIRL